MEPAKERQDKESCVSIVCRRMRELIQSKAWEEGGRIPSEHKLAEQFSVSRVVVREALQTLRTERWIITRHGAGSFVSNANNFLSPPAALGEQDFQELMELRRCIEFRAIELAAAAASDGDLADIRTALEQMEAADNLEQFTQADYGFHYAIVRASHNRIFCRTMDACREPILFCLREMNRLNDSREWGISLHQKIYQAMVSRNAGQAVKYLKQNTEYNYARLRPFFSNGGGAGRDK